jgi:hypothetical protein
MNWAHSLSDEMEEPDGKLFQYPHREPVSGYIRILHGTVENSDQTSGHDMRKNIKQHKIKINFLNHGDWLKYYDLINHVIIQQLFNKN